MMNDEVIYGLFDPREPGVVYYVGMTENKTYRFKAHIHTAVNGELPVNRWVRSLLAEGITPIMEVLDVVDYSKGRTEAYWIRICRQAFPNKLTNIDNGRDHMKLTWETVTMIRQKIKEGFTISSIAKVFGVSSSTISCIKSNRIYKTEKKDFRKFLKEQLELLDAMPD
jgi:hypothetical protein